MMMTLGELSFAQKRQLQNAKPLLVSGAAVICHQAPVNCVCCPTFSVRPALSACPRLPWAPRDYGKSVAAFKC